MNRSRNGSGGGSGRDSEPDLRRQSDREIRRVSGCCSWVEFHGDSEVDKREELQNRCRGDSKGLLQGDSRSDLRAGFYRGSHGDSYRDLRGESRREMRISVVNDRFYLPGIEHVRGEVRSFAAADGVKPFWTLYFARLESQP